MSSTVIYAVTFLACALTLGTAQTSCKGRCGAEYYRGNMCQCDYSCLSYGECCRDYESQCTTDNSCKGRCGESFKRGRQCTCDSNCAKFKQCCPDHKIHCDAEEEISGAASTTAPVKTNSCYNVNDNKPKEPTLNEVTEPSTFSEENNADDNFTPLVNPTSYPQDDLSDDTYGQIFPSDEFSNNGSEDPEASPIPESTSSYGSTTADLLDQSSTEPTQDPDPLQFSTETFTVSSQTQTTLSDSETTQGDDSPSTLYPTVKEAPTESTDASDATSSFDAVTTLPQTTTAADSSQPTPTTVPQTEFSPSTNTQDDILPEDPTVASINEPEVTTVPDTASYTPVASISTGPTQGSSTGPTQGSSTGPTQGSSTGPTQGSSGGPTQGSSTGPTQGSYTVLEASQGTTISASTPDPAPIPEATTSNPGPYDTETDTDSVTAGPTSSLADRTDPSINVSPAGPEDIPELDALTTQNPSSTDAVQDDTADDTTAGITSADLLNITPDPTKHTPSEATPKPQDKPDPYMPSPAKPTLAKPSSKPETKPLEVAQTLNIDDPKDYQADDSNDTNLCSGRPVSAVTTLRNGTMVVFRGHYFWLLDRYMVPSPAQSITQVWGVPSPIDTVFTRCNCQGKTYIFKGSQYWRFENGALDPYYPKVIQTGFDGLRGHITAALSVPQYQRRRESVYFFKRGGSVQKYSYQFGTSPTCGRKVHHAVSTVRNRIVRQAVSLLGPTINIRTSWRGFPSTITAAVSIPSITEPEGYKYHVFSRSTSYTLRMGRERPVIPAPTANESSKSNDFFKCQKKV